MPGTEANKDYSASTNSAEKKQEKRAELKNGKIIFKQKPLSLEKQSETMQEIVAFRSMLEERVSKQEPPLTTFPESHKPLIVKLAHESDRTISSLAKHVQKELLPMVDEDEDDATLAATTASLPIVTVENVIREVLVRNNYGVDAPLGVKLPAGLSVWRWEVREQHMDWLPKTSREKAEARLAERIQAKAEINLQFSNLPQEERDAILDPKKVTKWSAKELNVPETALNVENNLDNVVIPPNSSKLPVKKKSEEIGDEQNATPAKGPSRPKKAQDLDKAAKEKGKQEKKTAKLEKEQKEIDAHHKSQNIMAKFFGKPKASQSGVANAVAGPSNFQSDFDRVFKPFVLQKNKVLAPQNWFLEQKKRSSEIIVIDDNDEVDVEMKAAFPSIDELKSMSPEKHLKSIFSVLPPSATSGSMKPRSGSSGYKVSHPISTRQLMAQLSEAEISGNDDLVREVLSQLRDRDVLPAKAFHFHEDSRPGYFGTWTRNSRIIGPRTPFAKDTLVFDYGHDSGEEWEEEPAGEDVVEDGEDEDGEADDPDSDLDSWLVDDDEPTNLSALRNSASPPPLPDCPNVLPKRKAEEDNKKVEKKRKVVVPLVPFAKGPLFERTIGQVDYEPFRPYRIQLFNDTPMSIDPFTFVSNSLEDYKASQRTIVQTPTLNGPSSSDGFAVPALPSRVTSTGPAANVTGSVSKKPPPATKSVFPETYMSFLFNKINQLQASSITALVETVYQELKEHKVKKIAIEAKIREVGEKCKEKKIWVVKPSLMQLHVTTVS